MRKKSVREEIAMRYIDVDHEAQLLLPVDLREWVPAGHMVHFVWMR